MRPVTPATEVSEIETPVKNKTTPKKGEKVELQLRNDDTIYEGTVSQGGKTTDQKEDNMKVTYYTEHTDKEVEEKEDEILIIKVSKDSAGVMNHIIQDAVSKGRIEKCIWVDNKFDVLISRKNCDMTMETTMETRKDEAGEDCQLPDSYHHRY